MIFAGVGVLLLVLNVLESFGLPVVTFFSL